MLVRTRNLLAGEVVDEALATGAAGAEEPGSKWGQALRLGPHRIPIAAAAGPVTACIRPEEVVLQADGKVGGEVVAVRPVGALYEVTLDCGFPLVALFPRRSLGEIGVTEGSTVGVDLRPDAIHLIRPDPHD